MLIQETHCVRCLAVIMISVWRGLNSEQYTNARSFANGYAAVCSENNLWEFLNDEHKLCIDYTYKDALYFNSNETCLVSTTENTVQLFYFMFE